jgi:hypothetical protein
MSTTTASRTNGVYSDEPTLNQKDADFGTAVITGGATVFGNAARARGVKGVLGRLSHVGAAVTFINYGHALATDQVQPAHHIDAGVTALIVGLTLFPPTMTIGVGLGVGYGGSRIVLGEMVDQKINSTFR